MGKFVDRTGFRYGRLTVLYRVEDGPSTNGKRTSWYCRCDCGSDAVVLGHSLNAGYTTSCGCLQREMVSVRSSTHRMTRTPTHNSWRAMRARCEDESNDKYYLYGARGISVCDRWMQFENFLQDMGERPAKKTLDRIDPEGNYTPENCRWASAKTQSENRRGVGVQWKGMKRTVADIARLEGVPRTSLQKRIRLYGDDPEAAVARLKSLHACSPRL